MFCCFKAMKNFSTINRIQFSFVGIIFPFIHTLLPSLTLCIFKLFLQPKTVPRSADDYSDPWDSKSAGTQARPSNYIDPYDSKGTHKQIQQAPEKAHGIRDNYIEPWDKKTQPRDMKSKHKDDYKDPWDTTAPGSLPKSSFEEDDDYTVPYDAGWVSIIKKSYVYIKEVDTCKYLGSYNYCTNLCYFCR